MVTEFDQDRMLRLLERFKQRIDQLEARVAEPIAIVGIGCRFPGGAGNPESFWRVLTDRKETVARLPRERFGADGPFVSSLLRIGEFDHDFFRISAREAAAMDPQHQLLLQTSWEALEHAGIPPSRLNGRKAGVFFGIGSNEYAWSTKRLSEPLDLHGGTGAGASFSAGRISYLLGLGGPSLIVDTSCSSSLVAVHLACESLRLRECETALAGGVQLILSPRIHAHLNRMGALSPDGRCKAFSETADGFGRGEGCGVVILKTVEQAHADRDRILAIIRGSAIGHDGRSSGFTVPSVSAQAAVIRQALTRGGLAWEDIDYVEAHGTGTKLGDPLEMEALALTYGQTRPPTRPLVVGSVKTNIGHLEPASGVAGLIKVVLALEHGQIPAQLHASKRSPQIPWAEIPIRVAEEPTEWAPSAGRRRRAGVSSFGMSGTNAHVIVEEADPAQQPASRCEDYVLPVSARTEASLTEMIGRYERLLGRPHGDLACICYTAAMGRDHFDERAALVTTARAQASETLSERLGWIRGRAQPSPPSVAFRFTGALGRRRGTGALLSDHSVFREAIRECLDACRSQGALEVEEVLLGLQPVSVLAVQYALAKLWSSWGVVPTLVVGQGIGRYAAAVVAGALTLEDAGALLKLTSFLATSKGSRLPDLGDPLVEVGALASRARLDVRVRLVSETGKVAGAEIRSPDYWLAAFAAQEAQFAGVSFPGVEVVLSLGMASPDPQQLEAGAPVPTIACHIGDERAPQVLLSTLAKLYVMGAPIDWGAFYEGQGRSFAKTSVPTYAWSTQPFFEAPAVTRAEPSPGSPSSHPLLRGRRSRAEGGGVSWLASVGARELPYLLGHCLGDAIFLPGPVCVELALATAYAEGLAVNAADQDAAPGRCLHLSNVQFEKLCPMSPDEPSELEAVLSGDASSGDRGSHSFLIRSAERADRVYASGQIAVADLPARAALNLEEIRQRCALVPPERDSRPLAAAVNPSTAGWLHELWLGDEEALGSIETPAPAADYVLDTAVVDACSHVLAILAERGGRASKPALVLRIDAIRHRRRLGRVLWCYVRRPGQAGSFDMLLVDAAGQELVTFEGIIRSHLPDRSTQRHAVQALASSGGDHHLNGSPDQNDQNGSPDPQELLLGIFARSIGVERSALKPEEPVDRFGLDSMVELEILDSLEKRLSVRLPPDLLQRGRTLAGVAALLATVVADQVPSAREPPTVSSGSDDIHELVLRIVAEGTEVPAIQGSSNLFGLELSSLQLLELFRRVETECRVNLPLLALIERAREGFTIDNLVEMIHGRMSAFATDTQPQARAELDCAAFEVLRVERDPAHPREYAGFLPDSMDLYVATFQSGQAMEFLSCGAGPPVVLLPPAGGEFVIWARLVEALRGRFRVIAVNYPGFGRSTTPPAGDPVLEVAALEVGALIQQFVAHPVHLVGWSIGSMIATKVAARFPALVRSLTLVNATARVGVDDTAEGAFDLLRRIKVDFDRCLERVPDPSTQAELRRFGRFRFSPIGNGLIFRYYAEAIAYNGVAALRDIRAPALVVHGELDFPLPPWAPTLFAESLQKCCVVRLAQAAHYVPIFEVEELARLLAGHIVLADSSRPSDP